MDKIFDLTIDEHLSGRRIEYILEKHEIITTCLMALGVDKEIAKETQVSTRRYG